MIFGAIPPPRNFAKIRTRGGRGLQPEQPKDSIPPWGHSGTRRHGRRLCQSRAGAAERQRCAAAGRTRAGFSPGRRAAGAVPGGTAGAFGAEAGAFSPGGGPPTGRGRGLAAWGPQRPRVGRDGAGRARFRAAGRGRYTAAFRGGRGEGAGRAAVYGGRAGYRRGGGGPIAGARRAARRTGKKRSELRGLCRVTGHRWEWRQRRGRKGPFSLYKEALFAGARALSIQS